MIEERTLVDPWWAYHYLPTRVAPRAAFLIDGRMTMLEICCRFLSAKKSIYIAAWGITPDLLLVRGKHYRAGADGSQEQEELLDWLRAKRLEEQDLLFWQQCEALSVTNILSYAVSKGVDVRILLWDSYSLPFQPTSAQHIQEHFEPLGIYCLPDDSQKGLLNHPLTSMHQKAVVVDSRYAFVGREFTDDGINYLWELAPKAVAAGTLQAYMLGCSIHEDDQVSYRSIYVHGKLAIVDDTWITVGSANLNNRGMRDDAELNVAILHPRMAQGLRTLLMAEHLGLCDEDTLFRIIEVMGRVRLTDELDHMQDDIAALWTQLQAWLGDPLAGAAMFAKQAKENLYAVKGRQPLVGHLLPYIPHSRAQDYEVEINSVNGWLDMLPAHSQ
jgi:phosphatidylserine/phosphatidylglycerophosphate/cardiolipin synthase-like enzyme